jgi:hypothetical protein
MDIVLTEFSGEWELLAYGRQVWYQWHQGNTPCKRNFPTKESALDRIRKCREDQQKLLRFVIKHDLWGAS